LSKIQEDEKALADNYRRFLKLSAFVIFPVMMLLAALARPLIILMLTKKWEACIVLLQILCFSLMWYPIHAINLNLLQVKGRSDWFLKLELIKKIYGGIILAVTLPFGLIVFCLGSVLSSFVGLVVNTLYTDKLIHLGFWTQMKDLLPTFLLSLSVFVISWGTTLLIPNLWMQIFVGGIVGVVFYLLVAKLLRMEQLSDVRYLLRRN
jgi:O-antigen/teichoic acid export membrane protein